MGVPVPPAAGVVGWASFDPCVILGDVPPSSTTAISKTINGQEVRVALRFAAPPAASYVHLDTDDCAYRHDPMVVAADGDLLLINMLVNNAEGVPSWRSPENFFVCKVDPERPWLEGLPSLGDRVCVCDQTGIARCGTEDNFFVADLLPRAVDGVSGTGTGEVVVAELFRYSSATRQWDLKRLDVVFLTYSPYDLKQWDLKLSASASTRCAGKQTPCSRSEGSCARWTTIRGSYSATSQPTTRSFAS